MTGEGGIDSVFDKSSKAAIVRAVIEVSDPSVDQLLTQTGLARSTFYGHIKDLLREGVLTRVSEGRETRYTIADTPVGRRARRLHESSQQWAEDTDSEYRNAMWDALMTTPEWL